jgi:hypothetical protein
MSAANANVFPVDWLFSIAGGWGSFDVRIARLEDLFDAWVFAARDAELACAAWASGPSDGRAEAHAVYRAALDREERAAVVLAAAAPRRACDD